MSPEEYWPVLAPEEVFKLHEWVAPAVVISCEDLSRPCLLLGFYGHPVHRLRGTYDVRLAIIRESCPESGFIVRRVPEQHSVVSFIINQAQSLDEESVATLSS